MAKLTSGQRKAMPKSEFGLPGKKAYPMPDASHAANAKARASQQVNAGRMSPSTEAKIDSKANKVLGKSKGDLPKRGERTAKNREQHPRSHAEFEALGRDDDY